MSVIEDMLVHPS